MKTCAHCGREGNRGFEELIPEMTTCTNTAACDERGAKILRSMVRDRCIDCLAEGVETIRPAPKAGPRCVTHWRVVRDARKARDHELRLAANFELSPEQYWALYALQGGKCFGCQFATGKTKRLAVDHDHTLAEDHGHDPDKGCVRCVRALLCGPCNQIIGRLGVEALCRLIQVLTDPPARKWLAGATGE